LLTEAKLRRKIHSYALAVAKTQAQKEFHLNVFNQALSNYSYI
jgi:hypothetical protein